MHFFYLYFSYIIQYSYIYIYIFLLVATYKIKGFERTLGAIYLKRQFELELF